MTYSELDLRPFFPEQLRILDIEDNDGMLCISLKSCTNSCICPRCGSTLTKKRATYSRTVQDLPIFGKPTLLTVTIYEYRCFRCKKSTAEIFEGFLGSGSRMTERCTDFILRLALETSCEGASRILKCMGIQYSGDSIIRLLIRRLDERVPAKAGDVIGVDDFAFRKRQSYGTIIVDGETHRPIAILEGRDGISLKEWLQDNKHVKVVTRDRASAYAKAISEELPNAMQIADRFHLHQNLLDAIKKALNSELPNSIPVEKPPDKDSGKKRVTLVG